MGQRGSQVALLKDVLRQRHMPVLRSDVQSPVAIDGIQSLNTQVDWAGAEAQTRSHTLRNQHVLLLQSGSGGCKRRQATEV